MLKEYSPVVLLLAIVGMMLLGVPTMFVLVAAAIAGPGVVYWAWVHPAVRRAAPQGYSGGAVAKDLTKGLALSFGFVALAVLAIWWFI